jgi:hypothetical protein
MTFLIFIYTLFRFYIHTVLETKFFSFNKPHYSTRSNFMKILSIFIFVPLRMFKSYNCKYLRKEFYLWLEKQENV